MYVYIYVCVCILLTIYYLTHNTVPSCLLYLYRIVGREWGAVMLGDLEADSAA